MKRSCGRCTACCTTQGIREGLPTGDGSKLPGVRCPHVRRLGQVRKGKPACSIYETRPAECAEYKCMWLQGIGGRDDRPDRLGIIFEIHDTNLSNPTMGPFIVARCTRSGTDKRPRAQALIEGLRKKFGKQVVVVQPEQVDGWVTTIVHE